MIPTIPYIKAKFDEFNRLYFEGKLKEIPFKPCNARTFLGKITCFRKRQSDGRWHYYDFTFHINTKFDMPENVVEDTIIHEMIHYWILSNQMQDTSAHGEIFRAKMLEINMKYNRNISISHRFTKEDHDKDTEKRWHLICVTKLSNGKQGVTVAARSRLFRLWDEMAEFPNIAEQKWVISSDSYFNRIRRSLTPKIYIINAAELESHLKDSKELMRSGNTIKIKPAK